MKQIRKSIEYKDDIYKNYDLFLPPILRNHDRIGEFRKVVSCFIAFEDSEDKDRFIIRVMDLSLRYGRLL